MCNLSSEQRDIVGRQERVLRLAKARHGLSTALLSEETGIPENTLASYSKGTAMPLHNAVLLAKHLPDHLVSLWFEPSGKMVVDRAADEDSLLEQLLLESTGYSADHVERKADGIHCPTDKAALRERASRIATVAMRVSQS